MQKPTGKPGVLSDRIYRCIAIERRIQDEANAAILGADSAESGHSGEDGDALLQVIAENSSDYDGNYGDGEDEEVAAVNVEVAAVNAADENANENAVAVATVRPRPQSLPAFIGGGVGVLPIPHLPAFIVPGVGAAADAAIFNAPADVSAADADTDGSDGEACRDK